MRCERCGGETKGYELHDFCATCSKNLCEACMAKGCCGKVPAVSGGADEDPEQMTGDGQAARRAKWCIYEGAIVLCMWVPDVDSGIWVEPVVPGHNGLRVPVVLSFASRERAEARLRSNNSG